jgi:hypothetical protein
LEGKRVLFFRMAVVEQRGNPEGVSGLGVNVSTATCTLAGAKEWRVITHG